MRKSSYFQYWRFASGAILGTLAVAMITTALYPAHLNAGIPAFLFLLVVVTVSLFSGFAVSAGVSIIAVGCLDYFFVPPLLEWQITNPIDAVGVLTFWATSLVVTRLASNARKEAKTAERKRREVAHLYEAASELLALEPEMAAGLPSLAVFRKVFSLRAVALYDATTDSLLLQGESPHDLADQTHHAYLSRKDCHDPKREINLRCLRVTGKLIGAIGFEGDLEDEYTVGALSLIAANTLERAQSFRDSAKAAATAETEILRSAILDACAHEFKTPLAAIMAAAGGLRESGDLRLDQLEMTELIESESLRLGRLTTRLLRLARLDKDEVRPNMEVTDLRDLVGRLVKEYQNQVNDHSFVLRLDIEPAEVMSDPELLSLALVQLLDNAVKYSSPETPVTIELSPKNGFADILVTNQGDAIRPEHEARIFDRFFRGPTVESRVTSGTGLGLYVARKIVRAHSGSLVLDRGHMSGEHTTTFRMRLPAVHHGSGDVRPLA